MNEFKEYLFQAVDRQIPLKDFEQWLYAKIDQENEDMEGLILDLYCFNYLKKDAHYEFRKLVFNYYKTAVFDQWKIMNNLQQLSKGVSCPDSMIADFSKMAHLGYTFLNNLGALDDYNYYGWTRTEFLETTTSSNN